MRSLRWTITTTALAAAAVVTMVASPALALPKADGRADVLTFVGSDTIQYVDDALCATINSNAKGDNPGQLDTCVNVHAFAAPGEATKVAPADVFSPDGCTWYISPATAPTGSSCAPGGNGKESAPTGSGAGAARQEANPASDASVDVGRASSLQCGSSRPNLQCFAFARDAVGFATYRTQRIVLTTAQIQGIYSCSITDWSQIPNAGKGTIGRFFPQSGSGTGSFFVTNFLAGVDPRLSQSCPVTQVAENDGSAIPADSRANAIVPFSAASYVAQGNGVVPDTRNGIRVGNVKVGSTTYVPVTANSDGTFSPNAKAFAEGSAYPGARYVFHNLDITEPQYNASLRYVGFDSTGRSKLCSGIYGATLKKYGFLPLANLSDDSPNAGTCRLILS